MAIKMVEVYRVEHLITGAGPYRIDFDWTDCWHNENNGHPVPSLDGLESFPQSYHFGFETMKQLRNWFSSNELRRLRDRGYIVATYSVSSRMIRKGSKQIVFNKKKAKFIKEMGL